MSDVKYRTLEVPAIVTGDILRITWSGGNGPHLYVAKVEKAGIEALHPWSLVNGIKTGNWIELPGERTLHQIEVVKP